VAKPNDGPWTLESVTSQSEIAILASNELGTDEIARVRDHAEYLGPLDALANAALMAAAPDLLAALRLASEHLSDANLTIQQYGAMRKQIDAAIDAAEGCA
jgi:hypothetical protein